MNLQLVEPRQDAKTKAELVGHHSEIVAYLEAHQEEPNVFSRVAEEYGTNVSVIIDIVLDSQLGGKEDGTQHVQQ